MKRFYATTLVLCITSVSYADDASTTSLTKVDFAHEVMPILRKHCVKCHAGNKKKGGLAMNTRAELLAGGESGAVVVAGNAGKSRMIELLESSDDAEWMPPEGPRVSVKEIATLKKWIDKGLPWDTGITLGNSVWEPPLKPRVVSLPPPRHGRIHPIDRLLDADLALRGQSPPPQVSDAAFLRRATLDAIGLLPTPKDLENFVADQTNDKREKQIQLLMANDIAYADHWLTMWNDLLRNDYTGTGFITGGRKQITSWLYASLRENQPYDEFVRELISPTAESAGFIDGIKWRGDVNASQTREIQFAQNVSQVFLGINMKCASCHDSFIDRWTLSEAYNFAAIYSDRPLELNRCDKPTGVMATPKWIFPELGDIDSKAPKTKRLQQLAALMTHPENGRFTRTLVNRIWARLMGRGIVHPVDAMHTRPWNEDLLDYLAVQFAKDGYDLKKFISFVMTSEAYQSKGVILEKEPGEDYVYAGPIAKRMTAEQLIDSIWQITETNPTSAEAKVDRAEKSKIQKPKSKIEKLTPTPISAYWIWHSGEVGKKSQLRKKFDLSAAPTGAKLMATCDNAFDMKINGAKVATSRIWTKPVYVDITQHLHAGKNVIEVDARMFGGAAGFICQIALLDGAEQKVIASNKSWEARPPKGSWAAAAELKPHGQPPWGAILDPKAKSGPPTLPAQPVRAALVKNDFLMRSLGRPHRDQVVTTRPGELTTLQAIDLSNGEILAEYLRNGAKHFVGKGLTGEELTVLLFRYALSREPTTTERTVLAKVAGDGRNPIAVEDLLWIVFMQPEFQMIR
ncbi:MAG: PSD1 and planctomycete cytochrome C domain-containing protein [Planctomycetes bacterium]|nr:PSD1 and planctomycete cytochrome C domain-containing protein [Planctomycetota bacterium]MCH9727046.1 PSD1 and planctomycete cytochrome C domain-containing protein [Planctomycetota bacterium]MCH9774989.1 PSD1 and planctomycete cytochrome C domain-containing protein [Planctomycetota bacterium]MCH9789232.1 PSD1 and planctomycete cytochrome C domain-containing protein [Planctomycetota bacterium]